MAPQAGDDQPPTVEVPTRVWAQLALALIARGANPHQVLERISAAKHYLAVEHARDGDDD